MNLSKSGIGALERLHRRLLFIVEVSGDAGEGVSLEARVEQRHDVELRALGTRAEQRLACSLQLSQQLLLARTQEPKAPGPCCAVSCKLARVASEKSSEVSCHARL